MQEGHNNGYSPAIPNAFRGFGADNIMPAPAALEPSHLGYRQYPVAVGADEQSSDDSEGLPPVEDDGDLVDESLPAVKAQTGYDASASNWLVQPDLSFLDDDWMDATARTEGAGMGPFNSQSSTLVKDEDLSSLGLSDLDLHLFIDPARNTMSGGWQDPGGLSRLSGEVRNYVDYVSNDPTKTRDEIKSLLENIRPDMEIPKEEREGTPEAMYYPLMEHQKLGLAWLKKMEEGTSKGGILADDMGLGKTIQTLALLVARPSQDQKKKTTLIVTPVALLKQWEREISKKLKADHQLSVCIYHGPGKKAKSFADLAEHDGKSLCMPCTQ
jgi:hypothetical protein